MAEEYTKEALSRVFTVTVAVTGLPAQLLMDGMMVYTAVPGVELELVRVWTIIESVPKLPPVTPFWNTVQEKLVPGTVLVKAIEVLSPEQNVADVGVAVATGVGFTVTVTVIGLPVQPFAVDATKYVTVPGTGPVVVSTSDMVAPVLELAPLTPLAVEVQVKTVPDTELVRAIDVVAPEHIVDTAGVAVADEPGSGFTVTVLVMDAAGQLLAVPVMVYTAVPLPPPVATSESDITEPLLLLPPVTLVSTTVQLKLVPLTVLLRLIGRILPAQIVGLLGLAVITGIGSTAIVTVIGLPTQPLAVGVTVYTAVPCVLPVAVRVWAMVAPLLLVAPLTPVGATVHAKVVPGTKLDNAIDVVPPEHKVWLEGVAIANGTAFTVTVTCTQLVLLHAPSALTK